MTNRELIELNPDNLTENRKQAIIKRLFRKELISDIKALLLSLAIIGVLWLILKSISSTDAQGSFIADTSVFLLFFFGSLVRIVSTVLQHHRLTSGKYPEEFLVLIGKEQKKVEKKLAKITWEEDREIFLNTDAW